LVLAEILQVSGDGLNYEFIDSFCRLAGVPDEIVKDVVQNLEVLVFLVDLLKLLLLDVHTFDQLVFDLPLVDAVGRVGQLELVVYKPYQCLVCLFKF
jgi:hypothetical protein